MNSGKQDRQFSPDTCAGGTESGKDVAGSDSATAEPSSPQPSLSHPTLASPPADFLSPENEARAFSRMQHRILLALLRQLFAHSRFRVSLIVVLTALLWGGMFWMFGDGFSFMQSAFVYPETYMLAVGGLFSAFFFALMLMLAFSSGVILYGSLFRSREIAFLLTTPARTGRIFLHKFHQAILLSSWGFVLLGSPALLAYGVVVAAPWYYYALLPPFIIAFIYIPVAIGAISCMLVVRYLPRRMLTILVAAGVLLLAVGAWMGWRILTGPRNDLLTPGWFQEILGRMQISDRRLLPSWWLSTGLLAAADRAWSEGLLFLTLMISNALFFRQLTLWTAERLYRPAYSSLFGKSRRHKRTRSARLDRLLSRLMHPLPATVRLMTIKDLRLFRRDPLQWSQVLIFVGFLVLYFLYIPSFSYNSSAVSWVNMVSFLNLAVVGLLLSTFTTRFVFPMISLEGRRFWILGQLGVRRETLLWGKFLFAVCGAVVPCTGLVLLSDLMLRVPLLILFSHQLTCLVLCLGLAGLAVGLGAWLPNLREESPSRIAAGFGGTLTLVSSTLFILFVVLLTALPTHFFLAARAASPAGDFEGRAHLQSWFLWWWIAGTAASFVLGAVTTFLPLRAGFRAFREMEF
jgi:ABC-2 type transport system permease protein